MKSLSGLCCIFKVMQYLPHLLIRLAFFYRVIEVSTAFLVFPERRDIEWVWREEMCGLLNARGQTTDIAEDTNLPLKIKIPESVISPPKRSLIRLTAPERHISADLSFKGQSIRVMFTLVLTDENLEPVEPIRAFDPVMRDGPNSQTTWSGFKRPGGRWRVLTLVSVDYIGSSQRSQRGTSRRGFMSYPILTNYKADPYMVFK